MTPLWGIKQLSSKRGAGHSTSLLPLYTSSDFNQNVRTTMHNAGQFSEQRFEEKTRSQKQQSRTDSGKNSCGSKVNIFSIFCCLFPLGLH